MADIRFTQCAVRKALFSLDVNKSSGPDGISPIVLKVRAPELAPVLTRLFRHSYVLGVVPHSWKTALVHPIPKKGDRSDPSNYRPIAITSLLCKIMESIINRQLMGYLEEHQLISDRQYGFRKGRSAGDLLALLTHRWAQAVESRGEALGVSLDIAKAFDRHKALLSNNISRDHVDECRNKLVSEIESSLVKISDWGGLNLVQFNPSKTQVCAFTAKKAPFVASPLFGNTHICAKPNMGILGVDISSIVQFGGHLESKAKMASKKLGVLNRAKQYFKPAHRLKLYKAQSIAVQTSMLPRNFLGSMQGYVGDRYAQGSMAEEEKPSL
uniref:Reverse transcriptase domain-containing protein n=1 Tax=Bombyx mori TaxID=7091 RepID=A0A8R2R4K5_BOMMO|nr:uncharacterized protein LOC110384916 [Bombyx mori]